MEQFIYKKESGITSLSAHMQDFSFKKHAHEEYAIGVTLNGIQAYHLDGNLHQSHKNGVMIFNPEQAHDGMSIEKSGLDYIMLYIPTKLFLEACGQKEIIQFSTPITYQKGLATKIQALNSAIQTDQGDLHCSELLLSLTDHLQQVNPSHLIKNNGALVNTAKELMHANLHSTVSLNEISQELQLSKFQFIRLFQSQTGISPYQYFLNAKTEKAKKLIEQHKDLYIALTTCGFVDLSHLNKQFKSIYGLTAFEYLNYINT